MAARKPAQKLDPARKIMGPAPDPARKIMGPALSPIDIIRNPNFDEAMAQRNYANLMAYQQARLAAQGGDFTQGRLMGAPTEQPNPNAGKPLYFQALEGELQKQFLDKNPQLKPKPGTAFNQQLMQENYAKFLQNQMAEVNKFNVANPQYAQDIRKPNPILARQSEQSFLEGLLDYSKVSPSQVNVLNQLKSSYLNEGQGGGTQPSIPPGGGMGGPAPDQNAENIQREFGRYALGVNKLMQEQPQQGPEPISTIAGPRPSGQMNPQKMQAFQNFLQQGIQRSNTMNQDAAAGFANLQPGMQPTQPAMPVAGMGMGMQQPRQAPAPRKFSTVNTPSARFG